MKKKEKNELEEFSEEMDKVFNNKNSLKSSKKNNVVLQKPVESIEKLEDVFDPTIKETKQLIDERDNSKKLKVLSWVAFSISFTGIILNVWKNILCWPVWIFANCFWIYWAIKKKEWAQVWLWSTFILANFYGWYMWFIT